MKIAEIDWRLFWHALGQQRFTDRDRWLGRWVFADDGVKMSMQSAPSARLAIPFTIIAANLRRTK